ncbi:MAG: glycosyltransferase family 2 protein [Candidatus Nanoarchaeia archaeon]
MKKLKIILPTLNEEKAIIKVIKAIPTNALKKLGYETSVLVIDGNSKDNTIKLAKAQGAQVITQKGKGKGDAIKTVFRELKNKTPDITIMLDADYTYDPKDMPAMILPLIIGDADVTIGAREGRTHYVGNKILTGLANIAFKNNTTDLCTGYWAFDSKAIKMIDISANGFDLETDLFAQINKHELRIKAVTIKYRKRIGESKLRNKDAIKIMARLIRNIRDWNPIILFGTIGLTAIITALFFGARVVQDYVFNGYIQGIGTFLLTVFLGFSGLFMIGIGLILDLIERRT